MSWKEIGRSGTAVQSSKVELEINVLAELVLIEGNNSTTVR